MEGISFVLIFRALAILAIAVIAYVLIVRRTWSDSIRGVQLIRRGAVYLWENILCVLSSERMMRRSAYERYLCIVHGLMLTARSRIVIEKYRKAGVDQDGNEYSEQNYRDALERLDVWKIVAVGYFQNLPDTEIDTLSHMLCEEKKFLYGASPEDVKAFLQLEREKIRQDQHRIIGHHDRLAGTFPECFRE